MSVLFLQMEINFILFLQGLGNWLLPIMNFFTFLGSEYVYLLLLPLLYWCIDSAMGVRTALMLVFSVHTNTLLKMAFHTPRPYWVDSQVKAFSAETSFGLPSGHSTNAVSIWGTVARGFKRGWFTALMIFVMFMIGLSRVYLGVHFVQDVLAGWALGGLILLALSWLDKPITRWISSKSLRFQILFCLGLTLAILASGFLVRTLSSSFSMPSSWMTQAFDSSEVYPDPFSMEGLVTISGVFLGFSTGYAWLTKKWGSYRVEGSLKKRLIRFLVGLITVAALYISLSLISPQSPEVLSNIFRFIRYGLLGGWIAAGAPLLFKKLKLDQ